MLKILFTFILLSIPLTSVFAIECPEGKYLVRGHARQAYYRSDGVHVSSTKVSPYCRNYRDDGPLVQQFLDKMPKGWPHKNEMFKKCSKEKQQQISKILSSIPKFLTDVGKLKIYCPSKSETPNNPATSAPDDKIISLYDSSFTMDTRRVIVHELAHILWVRLSDKEIESYLALGAWTKDPLSGTYKTTRTVFSAADGATGPEEDFANNIEYFLIENPKFKKEFSKINTWIRNFIGDKK